MAAWRVHLILLGALAACGDATGPVTRITQTIYGGELAPADESVFYISSNHGACTATLIAPRTLLTAAHCVDNGVTWASNATVGTDGTRFRVTKSATHSGVAGDWSPDLGLVLLERPPPVPSLRWLASGPFPPAGTTIRHVGYGLTENGTAGERRQVTLPITGAGEPRFFGVSLLTGANGRGICFGDSGGPALMRDAFGELIVGVHSYTQGCGGTSGSALVFPYRRFVERWLLENEGPSCARDTRCVPGCMPADLDCTCGADGQCTAACVDGDDPDCPPGCGPDGVCQPRTLCPSDLDCLAVGTRCLRETQCADRVCTSDPQNPTRYCSIACSPGNACPTGYQCTGNVCVKTQRQTLPAGTPCGTGDLCEAGLKCSDGRGLPARCLEVCESSLTCLAPMRCDFAKGVCVAPKAITLDAGEGWEGRLAPVGGCAAAPAHALWLIALGLRRRGRRARASGASAAAIAG